MHLRRFSLICSILLCVSLAWWAPATASAGDEVTLSGKLIANGETIELPFVYAYALKEGFFDPADPAWKIIFVEHAIEERELDEPVWDSAYVELKVTRTAEFDDEAKIQVYGQSLKLSADSGGNLSGGTYPEIELETAGPDRFAGRVYHSEEQEFFDDTYQYDFTFSAPLSDPFAPIGDPLPEGGGEPGQAYSAWVNAIHAGDIDALKTMVPAEMVAQFDEEDAADGLEFMAMMTPTDIKILGGSSDAETAVLQVEGQMDGEKVNGEVTLRKMEGKWIATKSSW